MSWMRGSKDTDAYGRLGLTDSATPFAKDEEQRGERRG